MGIAAYNRGTATLRWRLDREQSEREKSRNQSEIFCHTYIDWRNGETRSVWCDNIGPLINQHRDHTGSPIGR
jgi:hypothetical protein